MTLSLGIIDQIPVFSHQSLSEAVANSVALAEHSEELGYQRYWLAEHHASPGLACVAPELMIPRIANATNTLKVGSGGIMLNHYSPYKIAEQFGFLASLFPRRIDLGLGRAPGSDLWQSQALAYGSETTGAQHYPQKISDLIELLNHRPLEHLKHARIPPSFDKPDIWLLASSVASISLAAELGLPLALAHFIDPTCVAEVSHYHNNYRPSANYPEPRVILGVSATCADTDERAAQLATVPRLWYERLQRGQLGDFPTLAEALAEITDTTPNPRHFIGSATAVRLRLEELAKKVGAQEIMLLTICEPFAERLHSYRLLAQAFAK